MLNFYCTYTILQALYFTGSDWRTETVGLSEFSFLLLERLFFSSYIYQNVLNYLELFCDP